MQLSNQVAVITGATSGIGLAATATFTREGARVVGFARHSSDDARRAVGTTGEIVCGDVNSSKDLDSLFAGVRKRFGPVNIVFVNAAVVKLSTIGDTTDALFDEIMDTNVKGAFQTLRAAVPHLADGASIIITTSFLNRIGFAGASVASMTKAALRSLVRVAAAEFAPRKIRVNALCPGAIETPLWTKLGLPQETLAAAGAQITARIPLARWGKAEEVANAALFLAGPASSYVNGIELSVDGGLHQV
jgi:NAD(P)-dependent dehydrogenase (short-subunit alcohol dehydrogenase family)